MNNQGEGIWNWKKYPDEIPGFQGWYVVKILVDSAKISDFKVYFWSGKNSKWSYENRPVPDERVQYFIKIQPPRKGNL